MKLLSIILLMTLVSCASHTPQEETQHNDDEAGRVMYESPATFR